MDIIKDFRKSLGLTQKQMAENLLISLSMYKQIEYGYMNPTKTFITNLKRKYPSFDTNIFFTK